MIFLEYLEKYKQWNVKLYELCAKKLRKSNKRLAKLEKIY